MAVFAATGHRPDKLGGYAAFPAARVRRVARDFLAERQPLWVISGMAQGWDMEWAEAADDLGIRFCAAVPFAGQETKWPLAARERYRALLARAAKIVTVCDGGYAAWKMQRRNEWMVDRADVVVALWDGSDGGTANCVGYAKRAGKPVENLWRLYAPTIETRRAETSEATAPGEA